MDEMTMYVGKHRERELTLAEQVTRLKLQMQLDTRAAQLRHGEVVTRHSTDPD